MLFYVFSFGVDLINEYFKIKQLDKLLKRKNERKFVP